MDRRMVLRGGVIAGAAGVALGGTLWRQAAAYADPAKPGPSPYGPLQPKDANGIQLPSGFRSRVLARSGSAVAGYTWHGAPDGGACFPDGTGWIYVSNAELGSGAGGAGALKFSSSGAVTAAYKILGGTNRNCAGGATPWRTWLSCEEVSRGYVFETDPYGVKAAVRHPAMGRFTHEAAAVDPDRKCVYLTEDESNGCFYRFTPSSWPSLAAGRLDVLVASASTTNGPVTWKQVPDPDGSPTYTRDQVSGAKRFNGGEGCYYARGICYFTTKGDNRVWAYDAVNSRISLAYDDSLVQNPPLTGVDNITGAASGDLFVAEDGGNMEICIITPAGVVAPFLRITGQSSSEICGPAFSPNGQRLYFSSQRGTNGRGITYEVTGPFRS